MAFKHKTDTVHYHNTVAEARQCESDLFALCEHGMSASLCEGPQHYPYDQDEIDAGMGVNLGATYVTTGNWYNTGPCEHGKCSWYDKCNKHRQQDYRHTGNYRDLFRAYND